MKRIISLLTVLVLLLSCSAASADAFTDLFSPFTHMNATLDKSTDDCVVEPTPAAMNHYATDGSVILPWFTRQGTVLMVAIVMKGSGALRAPENVMVVTEDYTYRLMLRENIKISSIDLDGQFFNMFLLGTDQVDMIKDIAQSDTVLFRFSKDQNFFEATEYALGAEAKAIFGAVYEAYTRYDAVINYPLGDLVINNTANQYCSFQKEKNTSVWD